MNIIDIQDNLKNFSENQLINEMQRPSGNAPQFLVLSEITRRKRMRDNFNMRKAADEPTVAQEAVASAGVPAQGIMGMSEAMAPKAAMAEGGIGSVMSRPMKSQMPQPTPMPQDGIMAMASGGSTGQRIEERRMKNGKIGLFQGNTFLGTKQDRDGDGDSLASQIGFGQKGSIVESIKDALGFSNGGRITIRHSEGNMTDEEYEQFMREQAETEGMTLDEHFDYAMDSLDREIEKTKPKLPKIQKRMASSMSYGGVIKAQNGMPLGLRQRNPGNIRPGAGFIGESGDDGGYATFGSDDEGLRAIQRLLMTYGDKYGVNTLRGLANRYAPPSDNNPTGNYIDFLADKTGIDPDAEINLADRGSDIIPAIVGFEQGQQPYSQAQIDRAIRAAGTDDPTEVGAILAESLDDDSPSMLSKALSAINPISEAAASTLTPTGNTQLMLEDDPEVDSGRSSPALTALERMKRLGEITKKKEAGIETIGADLPPGDLTALPEDPRLFANQPEAARIKREQAMIAGGGPSPEEIEAMAQRDASPPVSDNLTTSVPRGDDSAVTSKDKETPSGDPSGTPLTLEGEILKLQEDMKKSRDQDKWLSLAQAGLALMSSKEPTLLGALGEAGLSGLGAMKEAESRYQEGVIDLINARSKLQKAKKPAIEQKDILDSQIEIMKDPLATPTERARAKSIVDSIVGGAGFGLVKIPQQAAS